MAKHPTSPRFLYLFHPVLAFKTPYPHTYSQHTQAVRFVRLVHVRSIDNIDRARLQCYSIKSFAGRVRCTWRSCQDRCGD